MIMTAERGKSITWVHYLSFRVDEVWDSEPTIGMTEKERLEYVLKPAWRQLLKKNDFERNSYRRRVWRRLCLQKFERRKRIRRMKKEGHVPAFVLT